MAIRIVLPLARYPGPTERQRYWDEALRRARAVPGVSSGGLTTGLPPDAPGTINNFDLLDRPVEPGARQPVSPW
ncbi:MAG: hypothetical protein GWN07_21400, partial [Actinobacteria bacterium]|nr:hypothetical protein [Actinomycetota bacterium]